MPNPIAYSRRRRLVLQVVMVLVLGGTIGIAAIVRQVKIGPSGVPLTQSRARGLVKLRLPAWPPSELRGLPSNVDVLQAVEIDASGQPTGRVLECRQQLLNQGTTAEDYLISTFNMPKGTPTDVIKMAGTRGVFARVDAQATATSATRRIRDGSSESQIFACVIVQKYQVAVTVRLTVSGRQLDDRDVALLRQVARTIQLISIDEGSLAAMPPR